MIFGELLARLTTQTRVLVRKREKPNYRSVQSSFGIKFNKTYINEEYIYLYICVCVLFQETILRNCPTSWFQTCFLTKGMWITHLLFSVITHTSWSFSLSELSQLVIHLWNRNRQDTVFSWYHCWEGTRKFTGIGTRWLSFSQLPV